MEPPSGRIRPMVAGDDKEVRFIIGKATMEPLTAANRLASTHPVTISIWVALSCSFIQFMNWWPDPEKLGFLSYLRPIPAFAALAVPILALIDWINRPYFDKQIYDVLRRPDMVNIVHYYSRSPTSGFWILEFDEKIIGIIAVEAEENDTAWIRHFYIDEPYISVRIQDDLLTHAVNHAFRSSKKLKHIKAPDSPLTPHLRQSLRTVGFQPDESKEKIGVFRWKLGTRILDRADWEKKEVQTEK